MRVFDNWYALSPKRNTCKELKLPPVSSQLYLSCIFIVEKRELYSVRRSKGLVLPEVFNVRVFNMWY